MDLIFYVLIPGAYVCTKRKIPNLWPGGTSTDDDKDNDDT